MSVVEREFFYAEYDDTCQIRIKSMKGVRCGT